MAKGIPTVSPQNLTGLGSNSKGSLVTGVTPSGVNGAMNVPLTSIFNWFTPAQIADVVNKTALLDLSTPINAAFASGIPLYAPAGVYRHNSMLVIPHSGMFSLKGDNWLTEFRAMSSMTAQVWKDGLDVTGATVDPVYISDIFFNANRSANICIRIGASKDAKQSNIKCYKFLTVGFQGGDDSGTQSYTGFYGNEMDHIICDGDINRANTTVGMATTGILLSSTATDNFLIHPAASYVTTAGIDIFGGSNEVVHPHSFGSNQYQTGPMYNVRCAAPTSIISPECDNQTIAGIKISSQNVSVTGGYYYWSSGYTPTTWTAGTAPSIGQAVAVEVDSGIDTYSVVGGTVRNGNSANPTVRWLGSARTSRATVWGISPMFRQSGDKATNTVEKSLGVTRSSSGASFFSLDTPVNNTGLLQYSASGNARYDFGLDGATETGTGSAGSNFVLNAYSDSGVSNTAVKYWRGAGEWDFYGNIRVGSNTSQLGFYGATTLVSQATGYGTPTNVSKTASLTGNTATLAQVGGTLAALIVDLKALGLIAS